MYYPALRSLWLPRSAKSVTSKLNKRFPIKQKHKLPILEICQSSWRNLFRKFSLDKVRVYHLWFEISVKEIDEFFFILHRKIKHSHNYGFFLCCSKVHFRNVFHGSSRHKLILQKHGAKFKTLHSKLLFWHWRSKSRSLNISKTPKIDCPIKNCRLSRCLEKL